MADHIIGMDRGDNEQDIVDQTSSPTKDIEITIDLAIGMDKAEVLNMLDMCKNHIHKADWPMA